MTSGTDPSEDVLLELGRLVWAAITLEDVVYAICRQIKPPAGAFDDEPISRRIRDARKELLRRSADSVRDKADTWLETAAAALEERNAMLHSIPVTSVPLPGSEPIPDVPREWLTHFPRDRTRATVHTPLTTEKLAADQQPVVLGTVRLDRSSNLSYGRRSLSLPSSSHPNCQVYLRWF
jgi:hypothetical protein